jgi:hypothetical protein
MKTHYCIVDFVIGGTILDSVTVLSILLTVGQCQHLIFYFRQAKQNLDEVQLIETRQLAMMGCSSCERSMIANSIVFLILLARTVKSSDRINSMFLFLNRQPAKTMCAVSA